jgi:hypothetical protein
MNVEEAGRLDRQAEAEANAAMSVEIFTQVPMTDEEIRQGMDAMQAYAEDAL